MLYVPNRKMKFGHNWVMDTGVSQHMAPSRKWFATYEPTSEGVIFDNEHLCKVACIVTVMIKMHDG